tara:strand:+ start:3834 stop:4094 length:261 start_codon:yes stop_codon:yes gene_type:complete
MAKIMQESNKMQLEEHLELAREVSQKIIADFEPEQQREFLERVRRRVDEYYEEKINETELNLNSLNAQLDEFRGGRIGIDLGTTLQ